MALHRAARDGDESSVEAALKNPALVDSTDKVVKKRVPL